jgi:hypothetical protein
MVTTVIYTYKIPLNSSSLYSHQRDQVAAVTLPIAVTTLPLTQTGDATALFPLFPLPPTEIRRTVAYAPVQPQFDQLVGTGDPASILKGLWTLRLGELLSTTFEIEETLVIA